jgi:hypothetical protein
LTTDRRDVKYNHMKSAAIPIILALCIVAAPAKGAALPASAASPRGSVVFFEGDVKVDGVPAEIGKELGDKASIETGPGASCEIVFDGKNAIRIGQNSVAKLDFSGIAREIKLERGGVTAVLRKLGKIAGSDSFRVATPTAVAGVRGTSFCVWAEKDETYICACNGEVRSIDAAGANELDLKSAHHAGRYYVKKGYSTEVAPAGVEHHSDASVESLAARIGERIDWTKPD